MFTHRLVALAALAAGASAGCDVCSDACDNEPLCMSYECSAVQLRCSLNTQTWPDGYPSSNADYEDFAFCVKLQPPPPSPPPSLPPPPSPPQR